MYNCVEAVMVPVNMRNAWSCIKCLDTVTKRCSKLGVSVECEILCLFFFLSVPLPEGRLALLYSLRNVILFPASYLIRSFQGFEYLPLVSYVILVWAY